METETHDPVQLLAQLRQTLSADKLSIGFLIGAGCPCAIRVPDDKGTEGPLVPDIRGLTDRIEMLVGADAPSQAAYHKVMSAFTEDGLASPTIEGILNLVRSLREVAGKSTARGLSFEELDHLDRTICASIRNIVHQKLPNSDSPYHSLARFVLNRHHLPSEIFTTNYDLLAEQALESERVPYFDGFIGVARPFFDQRAIEDDEIPNRWARLWKLHGSVNWRISKGSKRVVRTEDCEDGDELLIHPSHMKYDESRRMPYLVMIDRLRNFIRNRDRPVALIVSGYSYRDQHLNEAIVESLKYNSSAACFSFQYGNLSDYDGGIALAQQNANLSLLAADGAVIRRREGAWVATPTTEMAGLKGVFEPVAPQADAVAKGEEATPGSRDEPQPCTFKLGDFKELGAFLEQFVAYGARDLGSAAA
jgi:hypothetical protein